MSRDVLRRAARPPDHTLAYGDHPLQVADVRLPPFPPDGPRPLVVVVHGGFWSAEWDRAHAGPQSEGLADAGYVVATLEYRRVGRAGGGWPGTFDDIARAVETVPALVAEAVGNAVEPARTVLVGHSAGGHLVAWAASRHRLPADHDWALPDPPQLGIVSLAGVLDLVESERRGLGGHAARALLGGSPHSVPERYEVASPQQLLPSGVPTALVHGDRDSAVPVEISRDFLAAANAAGDAATLREIARCGHFELIDPLASAWPTVLAAVSEVVGRLG